MQFWDIILTAATQASGTAAAPTTDKLLLSGDFATGFLLLSGDAQSGTDVLLLSGTQ